MRTTPHTFNCVWKFHLAESRSRFGPTIALSALWSKRLHVSRCDRNDLDALPGQQLVGRGDNPIIDIDGENEDVRRVARDEVTDSHGRSEAWQEKALIGDVAHCAFGAHSIRSSPG